MKKVFKCLSLIMIMGMFALIATSCGKKTEAELSRGTVDINPSIELMVDEEQKVISVSALNDDGSIIIAGEAIVGKDVEEATKIIVNVCTETGYIVKGETTVSDNNVKISVSGNTEYANELANKVKDAVKDYFDKSGIKAKVEQINALAIAELKQLVLNNSTFTEEEVEAMSEKDLLRALSVARMETAILISEDMKKLYFEAKEYEISFAEREETVKIIEELGSVYGTVSAAYKKVVDQYRAAVTSLENLKYDTLISPDSAYQKALVEMRAAKIKYLEQRSYVASLEIGDLKITAEIKLAELKDAYEKMEQAYVEAGNAAVKSLDALIATLKNVEKQFDEVDKLLASFDFNSVLKTKTSEIEAAMNAAKDKFFEDFEAAHKDDLEKAQAALIAQKDALKKSILDSSLNKENK